jgi:aminopeptidase-like protein
MSGDHIRPADAFWAAAPDVPGMRALPHDIGSQMLGWMGSLWNCPRSITGQGLRDTLDFIRRNVPRLKVHSLPSGLGVGDWTIPPEWNVSEAYIEGPDGRRLVDFAESTLHLVSYSVPVNEWLSRQELEPYLHTISDLSDAIPYVTSYYERRWGFCLSKSAYDALGDGPFHVVVNSTLRPGHLNFADLVIPGRTTHEILLTSYVCHPAMANNELSGPVVLMALARWLMNQPQRRYTYRLYWGPETIGAIAYLHFHAAELREKVKAGWVVTCVGDERTYSYLPSRSGKTLADRASLLALRDLGLKFDRYTFAERGSDERQWCWPTVDLPVCSLMRSKYGTYPEYHTSKDNMDLVTARGLEGSAKLLTKVIGIIESNGVPCSTTVGEPQLSRRNLYSSLGTRDRSTNPGRRLLDLLSLADGTCDLIDIAVEAKKPYREVLRDFRLLEGHGLVSIQPE